MKPDANRESVRAHTAYRAGRIAVDVLLVLGWVAALVLLVLFFLSYREAMDGPENVLEVTLAVAGAVIGSVAILAIRELVHAFFDMADRTLLGVVEDQSRVASRPVRTSATVPEPAL